MVKNRRKQQTTLTGALIGAAVAVICCAIGAMLVTYGTLNELLEQPGNGTAVLIVIMMAVIVGGLSGTFVVGEKRMMTGVLSGGILLAVILAAALLLDGPFNSLLPTTASVAIGTVIVCVLCMKKQKKWRHPKSVYR